MLENSVINIYDKFILLFQSNRSDLKVIAFVV